MSIYKNACPFLFRLATFLIIINVILFFTVYSQKADLILPSASLIFFVFITLFFRIPAREIVKNKNYLLSPADGKILSVEEIFEDEYLKILCRRVTIFMSVFDVHQNIIPADGKILYCKHHRGKYLVAFNPKSSSKNERTTVILEIYGGERIRISQIAGFIARRIVCNISEGDEVRQGDELGFIFFGSRVDIFLPLNARIMVKPGEKVKAKTDIIAEI